MKFIRNNTANIITLGNMFFGSIGAIHLVLGDYKTTALCIIISLVLDFLDGFVARALKSDSPLGIQLDSLADMISFGFIPGLVMYKALEGFGTQVFGVEFPFEIKYIGLLVSAFSCLRLAIFNLDTEQKYYFKGLNTPSNTILIFGMYYTFQEGLAFAFLFENAGLLILLSLLCSWLLVCNIKMISLKFKSKKLKDNLSKVFLLLGIIILVSVFGIAGIPLSVFYYMIVSFMYQRNFT